MLTPVQGQREAWGDEEEELPHSSTLALAVDLSTKWPIPGYRVNPGQMSEDELWRRALVGYAPPTLAVGDLVFDP